MRLLFSSQVNSKRLTASKAFLVLVPAHLSSLISLLFPPFQPHMVFWFKDSVPILLCLSMHYFHGLGYAIFPLFSWVLII